ncbi:unnamed protein product [Ambrosiozyma monospora]|uniref:Unnamed protein product n=1 Tax=Ambrosiozyma monospora TaxID=43982 RepID=A0ACB5SRP9_AMBMO|nr:unnamed protein product [Ambrosiozyma monospora]
MNVLNFSNLQKINQSSFHKYGWDGISFELDLRAFENLESLFISSYEDIPLLDKLPNSLKKLGLHGPIRGPFNLPTNLEVFIINGIPYRETSFPLITNWCQLESLAKVVAKYFQYVDCTELFSNLPDTVDEFDYHLWDVDAWFGLEQKVSNIHLAHDFSFNFNSASNIQHLRLILNSGSSLDLSTIPDSVRFLEVVFAFPFETF